MQYFEYIKIKNFKIFGQEITLDLSDSTVQSYAKQQSEKVILSKGDFYQLIPFCGIIDAEVTEKLDEIYEVLKPGTVA
jgi:hypothetical protein